MSEPRTDADDLHPGSPAESRVPERTPSDSRIEGAHVLASEAKEPLRAEGFTEEQILEWAEAYLAEEGAGDVEAFVAWVADRQSTDRRSHA